MKSFFITIGMAALISAAVSGAVWLVIASRTSRVAAIACYALAGLLGVVVLIFMVSEVMSGNWGFFAFGGVTIGIVCSIVGIALMVGWWRDGGSTTAPVMSDR